MSDSVKNYFPPFSVSIDLESGVMRNPKNHVVRHASDMRGHYADAAALDKLIKAGDPVHYEVFEVPVPEQQGHLMYCISKLLPGRVGQEFFMTKGHYHSVANTAEIYLCLRGEGYMIMKTPEGKATAEKMYRGQMVYVPPFWAHRSVNTGASEPLVSFCVYPGEAGQNYGDIETEGFPLRVFERNGKIVLEGKQS
ncbi:MAG: glucose-6-phosphate isomerase family protein [Chitinivibrionales bacterium]|nr:glucose-6-phosphate isomerase family protein [Chitinivibrionales bacterium]